MAKVVKAVWHGVVGVVKGIGHAVSNIADALKRVVDSVVKSVKNLAIQITRLVADTMRTLSKAIAIPIIKDLVNKQIDFSEKMIVKGIEFEAKTVTILTDAAYYAVKGVAATLESGNMVEILLTIAAAVCTGGASLFFQYVVPGFTQSLYMHGVISETWAQAINITAAIASMFFAITSPQDAISNFSSAFTAMGASSETALYLANAVSTGIAIMQPLHTIYGMYEAYRSVKDMEAMYLAYLAQFEAWQSSMNFSFRDPIASQIDNDTYHQESMSFADGTYFSKMPGQFLYGIYKPSREAYVPVDVAHPAYWIENTKSPYDADKEIANIMWDNKQVDFRSKFDLVPYTLDTGPKYGERTISGGGVAKREQEAQIASTKATITSKISQFERSIKSLETSKPAGWSGQVSAYQSGVSQLKAQLKTIESM